MLQDDEWVLHAASQDLACLAEVGLVPPRIFDTELGGRLAGYERVGLGAMVEALLGLHLEKGHSAADWSTRPLPADWLVYAALDVEVLVELRDVLEAELAAPGQARLGARGVRRRPARAAPRRRGSTRGGGSPGLHRLRTRRQYAAVRALWQVRDEMARRRDVAPGRILPDAALVAAVAAEPGHARGAAGAAGLRRPLDPPPRRHLVRRAAAGRRRCPTDELPAPVAAGDGPPPPNRWAERDPVAARRLARARAAVDRAGGRARACRRRTSCSPTPSAGWPGRRPSR